MSVTKVLFRPSVREQDDSIRLFDNVLALCQKLSDSDRDNLSNELKKLTNLLGK